MAKENNEQKHTIEDVLEKYAAEQEGTGPVAMSPESPTARKAAELKQQADDFVSQRMTLKEEQEKRQAEAREGARELGLGFVEVPLEDLPSRGMFYPADTKIHVRAASGGDLRKWSMLDETEIQQIDNAIAGVNSVVDSAVALTKDADRTARSAYRQSANARYTDVIISQLRSAESVCPSFKAKAYSLAAVYSK